MSLSDRRDKSSLTTFICFSMNRCAYAEMKGAIEIGEVTQTTKECSTFWKCAIIALAEFVGTATLLFLSCTGNTFSVQGNISSMHTSFAAGFAVLVVIQMFGHISGAHVNPVVSMAALLLNEISVIQLPVYIVAQLTGSLTGYRVLQILTSDELRLPSNETARGMCVNAPHRDISDWEAYGIETVLTMVLLFAICSSWDYRNSNKQDSVAMKIGFVVTALNISASAFTGASMNPARSFGPAVLTGDYTSHWVYWAAPTTGSLIATVVYKYIFLRNTEND